VERVACKLGQRDSLRLQCNNARSQMSAPVCQSSSASSLAASTILRACNTQGRATQHANPMPAQQHSFVHAPLSQLSVTCADWAAGLVPTSTCGTSLATWRS
jgi:hypothetical protein